MAQANITNILAEIEVAINARLKEELEMITEKTLQQFLLEARSKLSKVVADFSVDLAKWHNITAGGDGITIKINIPSAGRGDE